MTLASSPEVRTRYGLHLIVDQNNPKGIERMLGPVDGKQPSQALDRALAQISSL